MKNEMRIFFFFFFGGGGGGGWAVVFLSSAWKNVGMTMTCNWCDVMNIMLRKTQMAQKSDRDGIKKNI